MSTPPPIYDAPSAHVAEPGRNVPTYMAWSIIATILSLCLCCLFGTIPGIVAIVFSSKTSSALARGDHAAAVEASRNAKIWAWITTAANVIGLLWLAYAVSTGQWEMMMQQWQAAMEAAQAGQQ